MKYFLLIYSTLLLSVFSISQAQEPLWRKTADISTKKRLPNRFMHTRGLYHNDAALFELTQDTLYLYDIKTGGESKIEILTHDSIIDYSPNCRFLIVARNDTMFSYNIEQKRQIFLRKGMEKIVHYTINNIYALCEYGQVFNLETGELIRKVTIWGISDAYDEVVLGYDHTLVNFITGISKNLYYIGYDQRTGTAVAPDFKTIVSYDNNFMYIERLENDSVKHSMDIDVPAADIERCVFIDTVTLVVFKTSHTNFDVIDVRTGKIILTHIPPKNHEYGDIRFIYPGYKNIATVLFTNGDDCGGMPIGDRTYYHILIKPLEKNPYSFVPDNKIPYKGAPLNFTDENSVSFISNQSTIETFNAQNGEKISSWEISPYQVSGIAGSVLSHNSNMFFHNYTTLYSYSVKQGKFRDSIVLVNDTVKFLRRTIDGKKFICATKKGIIYIIDALSFSIQSHVELNKPLGVATLHGDTLFYCISGSTYIKKYNINTKQLFDSIFVASGVKQLGTDGSTYIPKNIIEVTRLKDNVALKNISFNYQMGQLLFLDIWTVDNIPGYWQIKEQQYSSGDNAGYAHIMTMQEHGDTLMYQKKWKNKFRCNTKGIVFSDDGRYCATISGDAFEVHKVINLISSVNENGNTQTQLSNSAYYIDGNVLTVNDKNEYCRCVLYSLTGENMGVCTTSNTENVTTITIPDYVRNGFYNMVLHSNKDIISKRIVVDR